MAVFNDGDIMQKWYYETEFIRLIMETGDNGDTEEYLDIPTERLSGIHIMEDFETMFFPLLSIVLTLEDSTYYKILEHKDECKVFLRIDKFAREGENEEKLLKREFINQKFLIIMDESDLDLQSQTKQQKHSTDYTTRVDDDTDDPSKANNTVKFYLFPDTIDGTKKNVDKVFTNCTVADAIAWLLYNAGIENTLMKQPDNTKIYDEFIIPPLSTLKALSFIDTYYGIYKRGSIMYFGLFYNYIIPYEGKCSVLPNGETHTDVCLVVPGSESSTYTGVLKNTWNNPTDYIAVRYNTITPLNSSISNDYISANNIQSIDSYENVTKVLKSGARHRKHSNFIKFFENKTENEDLPYAYIAQTNALSDVFRMAFNDTDVSLFTPYKRYNVLFEDSNYTRDYTGNYVLSSISHDFKSNGTEFSVSTDLTVKKITLDV